MSTEDPIKKVLEFAIQTSYSSQKLEEENKALREQLQKNEEILNNFEEAQPLTKSLQNKLKEKEALLEEKRKELIDVQNAIITTIRNQTSSAQIESSSAIPYVMNKVLENIMGLTEEAIDKKSTTISILSLFKVCDKLNHLFEELVEKNIITETEEERKTRIDSFIVSQKTALNRILALCASNTEEEDIDSEGLAGEEEEDVIVEEVQDAIDLNAGNADEKKDGDKKSENETNEGITGENATGGGGGASNDGAVKEEDAVD